MASCGRSAGARSLCCSPRCSDGLWSGLDLGISANYRALALTGVKRGARSYSLHFSRASPPSPLPGLALLAPALPPFVPSLLSVIILLTHLLVVSRTPFSRAARWCLASLFFLPFLSLSFPFFLPTCKDGNGWA
ncbi:hypothetical protein B0H13DRAFT_2667000 [Mycena leptocephala]|nr:hypothetical protein B0H13DRAFT_2667000 [Mycena leptocephala]